MRQHQAFGGIQAEASSRLFGGLEGLDGPGQLFSAEARAIVGDGDANGFFVFQMMEFDENFGRAICSVAFAGVDDDVFNDAVKCQLAAIEFDFTGQVLIDLAIDGDAGKTVANVVEDLLNRGC